LVVISFERESGGERGEFCVYDFVIQVGF